MRKQPTTEIFEEIKAAAETIWKDGYSDEHGYVTEKVTMINSIQNNQDNILMVYRMFDHHNKRNLMRTLSPEAKTYILNNE